MKRAGEMSLLTLAMTIFIAATISDARFLVDEAKSSGTIGNARSTGRINDGNGDLVDLENVLVVYPMHSKLSFPSVHTAMAQNGAAPAAELVEFGIENFGRNARPRRSDFDALAQTQIDAIPRPR